MKLYIFFDAQTFAKKKSCFSYSFQAAASSSGDVTKKKPAAKESDKPANLEDMLQQDRNKDLKKVEDLANTAKDPLMAKLLKRSLDAYSKAAGDVREPKKAKTVSFDIYDQMVPQEPVEEGNLEEAVKKSPAPATPAKAKPGAKPKGKGKIGVAHSSH